MRFSVFPRNFCHAILDFREQQAILIRPDIPPRPIDCDKVYPLPVTRTDDDEDLPFFSSIANFFILSGTLTSLIFVTRGSFLARQMHAGGKKIASWGVEYIGFLQ